MRGALLLPGVLLASFAFSQGNWAGDWDDPPQRFRDRIWVGGGLNLGFGTVTAVQMDPVVGYKVDEKGRYSVGVGFSYWYYRDNRYVPAYTFSGKGYRVFNRFRVIPPLFLHAEFLHLNVPVYDYNDRVTRDQWVPHILVGGGYMQRVGRNSSIYLQLLYEVLQHPNSVYRGLSGPILGGGVGIGF